MGLASPLAGVRVHVASLFTLATKHQQLPGDTVEQIHPLPRWVHGEAGVVGHGADLRGTNQSPVLRIYDQYLPAVGYIETPCLSINGDGVCVAQRAIHPPCQAETDVSTEAVYDGDLSPRRRPKADHVGAARGSVRGQSEKRPLGDPYCVNNLKAIPVDHRQRPISGVGDIQETRFRVNGQGIWI